MELTIPTSLFCRPRPAPHPHSLLSLPPSLPICSPFPFSGNSLHQETHPCLLIITTNPPDSQMGCVQTKPSMNSPRGGTSLDKMKLQNGYTPAAPRRRSSAGQDTRQGPPRTTRSARGVGTGRYQQQKENNGGEKKERKREVEELPRQPKVRPVVEEEEVVMVDGWPKWLTDNIPKEALAGLVPRSADSYVKLDKVGQGTYSNVYKARDRDTGKVVALKKVRFDTTEAESIRFMAREIMVLQKLDHPNIIKLEGLATSRMQYSLYLVFEFMPSDLARVISRTEGTLTEQQVKCYMQQLLSGLKHCHERGILHRDIKGSNLLIDKQGMLKIGDFGLANFFNPNKRRPLTTRVVTLWYRAPELLLGTTDYGVGIDLWSAGCLLAEMFAGRPIMPGRTEVEQLHRIFKLCGSPPEDYWRKLRLSTSFRPPQPYKPNIMGSFRDFPSSSLGLLKILLALDPTHRGSAASALQNEFFTTSPLACDLSGLPVVYKEEDEAVQPRVRRKRRSSKLKQQSRAQEEATNGEQELLKPEGEDYGLHIEMVGVGSPDSHEPGSSPTGNISSSMQPPRHSVGVPPSLPSAKSPSFRDVVVVQAKRSHELGSSTTGSTSSGLQLERYSVSPPPSPPPLLSKSSIREQRRSEAHPAATKNIHNLPPRASVNRLNNHRYGMEKRSASTSGFRRVDGKQFPKR